VQGNRHTLRVNAKAFFAYEVPLILSVGGNMKRPWHASRRIAICGAFALWVSGCASESITNSADQELQTKLIDMGFRSDMIKDKGDYFLVEGDIVINKSDLRASVNKKGIKDPVYQYTTNSLVDQGVVQYVTVNLSGLSSYPDWQNAARDAMGYYNDVVGSRIRFSENSSNYRISIVTYSDGSESEKYTLAHSSWPNGYNPGSQIRINLAFYYNPVSYAGKVLLVAHELGHAVGFRHSNWWNNPCIPGSEGTGSLGANQVSGTPTSDASSVMNGCTAGNPWNGFSYYDRIAFRVRYNGFGPKNQTGSVDSGHPKLSWSAATDADSYNVYYKVPTGCYYDPDNGTYCSGETSYYLGSTTDLSFVDTSRSTTGTRSCDVTLPYYVASAVFPTSGETIQAEEFFNRSACFY
jgi:hypothetical protein